MQNKVLEYVKKYHMLEQGDRVVLGVSGGGDSVAMLALFVELKDLYDLSLCCVHVNHGIRRDAGEDCFYVEQLCEKWQLPFVVYEADIPKMAKDRGMTEEEMGRVYRYRCFAKTAKQYGTNKIAVAHHMGDQAETVLFHMIRGTDLQGLSGIRPVSDMQICMDDEVVDCRLLRPFLCVSKEEILSFLEEKQLSWREDSTNKENAYARNRIRNCVMPQLEEVHGQAVSHIAQLADVMEEYRLYFEKQVNDYMEQFVEKYPKNSGEEVSFPSDTRGYITNRERLLEQEPVLLRSVLYEMMKKISGGGKNLTKEHVLSVWELLNKQSGRKIMLPYEMEAVLSYENLIIRKSLKKRDFFCEMNMEADGRICLPGGGRLEFRFLDLSGWTLNDREKLLEMAVNSKNNYTKFFDCATIRDKLCVREGLPGDYLVINDKGNRKTLSKYYKDSKLSEDSRRWQCLLAVDSEVLWVIGKRRGESYKLSPHTRQVLEVVYKGDQDESEY